MNKIIQFHKIGQSHRFAGAGFGSNIAIALNIINNLSTDDTVYIDMETVPCVCTEENFNKFNTSNCWEYYYDQISLPKGAEIISSLKTDFDKPNFDYRDVNLSDYSNLQSKFNKSFKLKDYIKEELDLYYNNVLKGKQTLGVHIRLTDMAHHNNRYYNNKNPLDSYINKIKFILSENTNINQIFIATDDSKVLPIIEKSFNIPVVYHNLYRATNERDHIDPYERYEDDREFHKYHMGLECIKEIYTLSKCNYLLKAPVSAISNTAVYLSTSINKLYKL